MPRNDARLRDELLSGEIFHTLAKARIVIESWRRFYNTRRLHVSLGYGPPALEVVIPQSARAAVLTQPASPPPLAHRPPMHQHLIQTVRWGAATGKTESVSVAPI